MDTEMDLGYRLRVERARKGLTLLEAARRSDVSRTTISQVEMGHYIPHNSTLGKIAALYDVDVEEILVLADEAREREYERRRNRERPMADLEEEPALPKKGEAPGKHHVRTSRGSVEISAKSIARKLTRGEISEEEAAEQIVALTEDPAQERPA